MHDDTMTLAQKAALLYYQQDQNQSAIARQMNISRSYVAKLLRIAREQDIVEIILHIDQDQQRDLPLEVELESHYSSLRQAYVLRADPQIDDLAHLGQFGGPIVAKYIDSGKIIGLNHGRTLEQALRTIDPADMADPTGKRIVQLMGGLRSDSPERLTQPNELVSELSKILGCAGYFLNSPVVIENSQLRKQLLMEADIAAVTASWDEVDTAILGIGAADKNSRLFTNQLTSAMQEEVVEHPIAGEINLRFFDDDGEALLLFEQHKMSMTLHQLKKVPTKIVLGEGNSKVRSMAAALSGGYIDVLITTSPTARMLVGNNT